MYGTWLHLSPGLSLHVEGQLSVLMERSQARTALRSPSPEERCLEPHVTCPDYLPKPVCSVLPGEEWMGLCPEQRAKGILPGAQQTADS